MPNSNQTIIDRVRSGTGTTAMEYTEYRVDVLALCNFAEQAQADLARVTAERDQLQSIAEKRYEEFRREANAHFVAAGEIEKLETRVAELEQDYKESLQARAREMDQAEQRNDELEAALRGALGWLEKGGVRSAHVALANALARAESATPAKQEVKL